MNHRFIIALITLFLLLTGCTRQSESVVVVYTSQDRVYSEPILNAFEESTGIRVRAVYDSEAVKTVGLANRLLAERSLPQCDVFWSNEELRTHQLDAQQVFRPTNGWAAFGYRSRRLVINTNHLSLANAPASLEFLTNAAWKGKIVLAYPLFGTTATHFLALRQVWGEEKWKSWCEGLIANEAKQVDGNSVVVRLVGQGEAWIGLTDSDDIHAGQRSGLPIAALPILETALLIPNTVAVVNRCPNPEAAQTLFDYLQSPAVVQQLVKQNALEGADHSAVPVRTLHPDWARLVTDLQAATDQLKSIFLR